jgi:hypothetical protein
VPAKEFGPRKIRVNSINSGIVETEGTHTLASNDSRWLTGEKLVTSGGCGSRVLDGGCASKLLTHPEAMRQGAARSESPRCAWRTREGPLPTMVGASTPPKPRRWCSSSCAARSGPDARDVVVRPRAVHH